MDRIKLRPEQQRPIVMAATAASFLTLLTLACTASGGWAAPRCRSRPDMSESAFLKGHWPFEVSLHAHIRKSPWWWIFRKQYVDLECHGIRIARHWVLTTSNCFSSPNHPIEGVTSPENWVVRSGYNGRRPRVVRQLTVTGETEARSLMTCSERGIKLNSNFAISIPNQSSSVQESLQGTVALRTKRELPNKATEDSRIDVVALPLDLITAWSHLGDNCVLKGCNCTDKDDDLEQNMSVLKVTVLPVKDCEDRFGNLGGDFFCARFSSPVKDTCKVRSGSFLICDDCGTWRLAGMASYISSTENPNGPNVYISIMNWLANNEEFELKK